MRHEECNCKQHHILLYGSRPDQTDGLLYIAMKNCETLHGTEDDPGGLIKKLRELEQKQNATDQLEWRRKGAYGVLATLGGFAGAFLMKILMR